MEHGSPQPVWLAGPTLPPEGSQARNFPSLQYHDRPRSSRPFVLYAPSGALTIDFQRRLLRRRCLRPTSPCSKPHRRHPHPPPSPALHGASAAAPGAAVAAQGKRAQRRGPSRRQRSSPRCGGSARAAPRCGDDSDPAAHAVGALIHDVKGLSRRGGGACLLWPLLFVIFLRFCSIWSWRTAVRKMEGEARTLTTWSTAPSTMPLRVPRLPEASSGGIMLADELCDQIVKHCNFSFLFAVSA